MQETPFTPHNGAPAICIIVVEKSFRKGPRPTARTPFTNYHYLREHFMHVIIHLSLLILPEKTLEKIKYMFEINKFRKKIKFISTSDTQQKPALLAKSSKEKIFSPSKNKNLHLQQKAHLPTTEKLKNAGTLF